MLFVADARIDDYGKLRFQLGRDDIPVSSHLPMNIMVNTDKEYAVGLCYIVIKYSPCQGTMIVTWVWAAG
jgi:hypothetical protein